MRVRAIGLILAAVLLAGCEAQPTPEPNLPGVYAFPMPARCEWWVFTEESHVGEWALALACPGIDLMRLYPWPPVQPWDESPSHTPGEMPEPPPTPAPITPWQTIGA